MKNNIGVDVCASDRRTNKRPKQFNICPMLSRARD